MELFGTAGIRGSAVERVTPNLALAVGRAAGVEAVETDDVDEFVVGRDGRTTGSGLADAAAAGLQSAGVDVERVGVVPTPTLAFATRGRHGLMLTASHNPPADNGVKLFADGREYDGDRERAVEARVESTPPRSWDAWGTSGSAHHLSRYRDAVTAYARGHGDDLDSLAVAVDCGNGTAGLATPQVLRRLGARVVALGANVDGHFPARESKPTPESLAEFRAFVRDAGVDLGIAHDGDADRVVFVAPDGEVVHEDTAVAVLAEHYVRAAGGTDPVVVTTPNASARIDDRVRAAGGRVERVGLGALHEGIASARADGGDVAFAAEPWKHVHPTFGGWIDGVVSAAVFARLVAAATPDGESAAAGLAALRDPIAERPYRKLSVPCPDAAKEDAMARLASTLPAAFSDATVDDEYGLRVERPDGSWALVRPSGTEAYVRVYAESEDVDALVDRVRNAVLEAVEATT